MITYEELKKQISKDLNIDHLPVDDQEKIVTKLGEVMTQKIALEILKNLPENKREEFKKLSESDDIAELDDFVRANIPDSDDIIAAAMKDVIDSVKK